MILLKLLAFRSVNQYHGICTFTRHHFCQKSIISLTKRNLSRQIFSILRILPELIEFSFKGLIVWTKKLQLPFNDTVVSAHVW